MNASAKKDQRETELEYAVHTDLYLGDCLEIMRSKIDDKSIDLVLVDPPYGTTEYEWDSVIPFEPMWEELNRVIKNRGAMVFFGSEPFSSKLKMSNIKNFKYDWIWNKKLAGNGALAKIQPLKIHEVISVFSNGSAIYMPKMTTGKMRRKMTSLKRSDLSVRIGKVKETCNDQYYPTSLIEFSTANMRGKKIHKSQKPVPLLEYLIETYTLQGETVLDFTMGSGSAGVASKNLYRKFIGIERDPQFFNLAKHWINTGSESVEK